MQAVLECAEPCEVAVHSAGIPRATAPEDTRAELLQARSTLSLLQLAASMQHLPMAEQEAALLAKARQAVSQMDYSDLVNITFISPSTGALMSAGLTGGHARVSLS